MSISGISLFSNSQYLIPLTIQLSDDPQSRYTIANVYTPTKPAPPSPPSVEPFPKIEKMDAVPEELAEDPFFQEYTDPIYYTPIFDPVADKNEPKHIYERASIIRWLKDHHTSPLTRKPMTEDDLVPVPQLKEKINEKIRDHLLQKQPELLQKHKEKQEEAHKQYQKALDIYHKIDLPQYDRECGDLPLKAKVSLIAERSIDSFSRSLNPQLDGLKSLQGRVTVISSSNPLASKVQSIFFRTTLGIFQPDEIL